MSRGRALLFGSLTILSLLMAAGCPFPRIVAAIRLQVLAEMGPRGIAAGDFEVTSLRIRVLDSEDQVLRTIDWEAAEGPRYYLIAVEETGQHGIEVTHFGRQGGEEVEAAARAFFPVPARQITVIDLVPGCIGLIRIQE